MKVKIKIDQPIFDKEEKVDIWMYVVKTFFLSSPPRLINLQKIFDLDKK